MSPAVLANPVLWWLVFLSCALVLILIQGVRRLRHKPAGKAMRRVWRLRKRSHRRWHRDHSPTPRFADKPLKRSERRAWDDIEGGYYRTAPARSEPDGGPR